MSYDDVHAVAQGRVWTGRQAKDRGLVDILGGLDLALAVAKEKAGLHEEAEVEIVTYPKGRPFWDLRSGTSLASTTDLRSVVEQLKASRLFEENPMLMLMPYRIDVK